MAQQASADCTDQVRADGVASTARGVTGHRASRRSLVVFVADSVGPREERRILEDLGQSPEVSPTRTP